LQQEVDSSLEIIESLRQENEELGRLKVAADAALQESRLECDTLRSMVQRLQQDTEALSAPCLSMSFAQKKPLIFSIEMKENLFRSFDVQLSERDDHIASVENELKSCYARLRENESEHRKRHEEDKMSISAHARLRLTACASDDVCSAQR
jgi:hypothetical protein